MTVKLGDLVFVRCGAARELYEGRVIKATRVVHRKKISFSDELSIVLGKKVEEESRAVSPFNDVYSDRGRFTPIQEVDVYIPKLGSSPAKGHQHNKRKKRNN